MEKYFELQYNMHIFGLIVLGVTIGFFVIFFGIIGIKDYYKSHSKKYHYDLERGEYVRKEDKNDRTRT